MFLLVGLFKRGALSPTLKLGVRGLAKRETAQVFGVVAICFPSTVEFVSVPAFWNMSKRPGSASRGPQMVFLAMAHVRPAFARLSLSASLAQG